MKRKTKKIVVQLLNNEKRRLKKSEIAEVCEQFNISGEVDTQVFMRSGCSYLVQNNRREIEAKLGG